MSSYSYVAVNSTGAEMRGTLEVPDQLAAVRRVKEMGLFPTSIQAGDLPIGKTGPVRRRVRMERKRLGASFHRKRAPSAALTAFTRQTATLVEAGMPLLRGLRILEEQQENRVLREISSEVADRIEAGGSLAEALEAYPRTFNPLYRNMVRAGEISGALDVTLKRLAEFMEKSQKIRNKVKAAMFYPCAVLMIAAGILMVLLVFVVPRFQEVFDGLLEGRAMPAFTQLVLRVSQVAKAHAIAVLAGVAVLTCLARMSLRTHWGRSAFDILKLNLPGLGPVFRNLAVARSSRTLATLLSSGVPILQALSIVRDTAGNVVFSRVIERLHARVKEGEPLSPTLRESGVFPPMMAGMVDVGEQTGALPEMLNKVADNYDDAVDTATTAMTSLLEPVLIVFLAVIVGSIVIAMFLPLIHVITGFSTTADAPE